jgi:dipeptidyl aminopeptidase/acylaminoacyl peptidase
VSVNGIANLPELLAYIQRHGADNERSGYWRDDIGSPFDPKVIASSPIKAIERIKSAVMLIYSSDDTMVPPSQSRDMARELRAKGKEVTALELPGDDHSLVRSETRVRMLKGLELFLSAHLLGVTSPVHPQGAPVQ